jgi:hypothetical protein
MKLRQIIGGSGGTDSYEWFLYLFPQKKFFKELSRISNKIGIDVWDGVQDELWVRGLVSERGEARMGKGVRDKIKKELRIEPLRVKVKRKDVMERQGKGKEKLLEYGQQMGFMVVQQEVGLTMWNRDRGFLLNCGTGWAYVYKMEGGIMMDRQCPMVGYFRMDGADVQGKLSEAMNGKLMWRSYNLGVRRRLFRTRAIMRKHRVTIKRKQAEA